MGFKSRWTVDIPECSLPTYIFKSPQQPVSKDFHTFVDADRPETHFLTTFEFRLYAQRLAAGLKKAGFQDGERVLVFSPNTLFYPVAFMGVIMAGGVFTGANPTYTTRELAYQFKDSGSRYLFCVDDALDTGIEAMKSLGKGKEEIFVFNSEAKDGATRPPVKGCRHWTDLLVPEEEGAAYQWKDLTGPGESANTTLALNYSSGTTGLPKGVEVTHRNYITSTIQTTFWIGPKNATDPSRFLGPLPMYHAMGQSVFVSCAKEQSRRMYIMTKFDFANFVAYIEKFRITSCLIVPPIAVALAKSPLVKKYDLSSMSKIVCAAAPLGMAVTREVENVFGNRFYVRQGWGMTEATCGHTAWRNNDDGPSTSVGELLPNAELKIIDEDGVTELGVNQPGELYIRGPNIMKGYWNRPDATRAAFTEDGQWYKTGDIGYVTEEGLFYIVDRKKELIKVKGNQVAPAELEALLLQHPAVADTAVIGISRDYEEFPRAYIVLKPDHVASEKEIFEFISKRVHRTKRLTGGVRFVEAIPKNPSGKILRRALREQAKREEGANGQTRSML